LRRRIVTRMMVIQTAGLMSAFCFGEAIEVSEAVLTVGCLFSYSPSSW
jgi:hypothetical protein